MAIPRGLDVERDDSAIDDVDGAVGVQIVAFIVSAGAVVVGKTPSRI